MQHTVSSARDPHAEIFLSKVLVEAGGGCLIYPMKPRPNGYCVINSGNKLRRAHRIAWELANHEPIPAGWVVDHICHNRACCNPEHLRICTQGQNLQNRKGAQPHSRTAVRGVTYRESTGRYIVKAKHQQLGFIDRCVRLWSNPGELVLTPFAGIGSELYQSVKLGRRAIGIELKPSYWRTAVDNLTALESEMAVPTLFEDAGLDAEKT